MMMTCDMMMMSPTEVACLDRPPAIVIPDDDDGDDDNGGDDDNDHDNEDEEENGDGVCGLAPRCYSA